MSTKTTSRTPQAGAEDLFVQRWSPRAFSSRPIADETLAGLFEAARWSPSCYNAQPWLYVYADSPGQQARFVEALVPGNQTWAKSAPVLAFLFARKRFEHNNRDNRWAGFDAGASWMALALQARLAGLYTHGMAGFDPDKAYEACNVNPEEYDVMAAIAIGYMGDPDNLPEQVAAREKPSDRKPLPEVARKA